MPNEQGKFKKFVVQSFPRKTKDSIKNMKDLLFLYKNIACVSYSYLKFCNQVGTINKCLCRLFCVALYCCCSFNFGFILGANFAPDLVNKFTAIFFKCSIADKIFNNIIFLKQNLLNTKNIFSIHIFISVIKKVMNEGVNVL